MHVQHVGSWVDRHTRHNIVDRKLMKDTDMKRKLLLDKLRSYGIYKQLERDAGFLRDVNIMDYRHVRVLFSCKTSGFYVFFL